MLQEKDRILLLAHQDRCELDATQLVAICNPAVIAEVFPPSSDFLLYTCSNCLSGSLKADNASRSLYRHIKQCNSLKKVTSLKEFLTRALLGLTVHQV